MVTSRLMRLAVMLVCLVADREARVAVSLRLGLSFRESKILPLMAKRQFRLRNRGTSRHDPAVMVMGASLRWGDRHHVGHPQRVNAFQR